MLIITNEDGTEQRFDPTECFYDYESKRIMDFARPDGRSCAYTKTLDQMREEYPHVQLMPYTEAHELVEATMRNNYNQDRPVEITAERFNYMLGVLPPMQWTRPSGRDEESFLISEMLWGPLTEAYVRIGERYFEVCVDVTTHKHDWLIFSLYLDPSLELTGYIVP